MKNNSIDLCFWNKCNSHCVICTNPDDFWKERDYGYDYIRSRFRGFKGRIKSITVTGGEPTIHPDFSKIVELIKSEFPTVKINLLTNGRRLYYASFARKCCELNNINIAISLHGYNARTHDGVTSVKGSFTQSCRGIRNILRYKREGQVLETRVVITKLNYRFIDKILRFISTRFPRIDRLTLVFMEIEGKAEENIKKTGLTYTDFLGTLAKIEKLIPKFKEFRFYHFPLCAVEKRFWKYIWNTLPKQEVMYPGQCKKCWCRLACLGVHKGYIKTYGDKEFRAPEETQIIKTNNYNHPISHVSG